METISAKSGSGSRQEWLREEQYLKCKDIHRALEINIPEFDELIKTQKANAQPIFVYSAKDSATAEAQKSNKSTSRSLSSKYQTANSAKTLPAVSESHSEYSFAPNIQKVSKNMVRGVNDLFRWQEAVEKKREMKRELQNVIETSNSEAKVYTNKKSEELLANIRPGMQIEESFAVREEKRKLKLKKLEELLYDRPAIPEITAKARNLKTNASLLNRLYDIPLQKRQSHSLSRSLTPSNFKETSKRNSSRLNLLSPQLAEIEERRPQSAKAQVNKFEFKKVQPKRDEINNRSRERQSKQEVESTDPAMNKREVESTDPAMNKRALSQSQEGSSQAGSRNLFTGNPLTTRPLAGQVLTMKKLAPGFHSERSNLPNMLFFDGAANSLSQKFSVFQKIQNQHDSKELEKKNSPKVQAPAVLNSSSNLKDSKPNSSRTEASQSKKTPRNANDTSSSSGLLDRNHLWLQQKSNKTLSQRQEKENNRIDESAFQPSLYQKKLNRQLEVALSSTLKLISEGQSKPLSSFQQQRAVTKKVQDENASLSFKTLSAQGRNVQPLSTRSQNLQPREISVKINYDEQNEAYNICQTVTPKKSIYNDIEKQNKLINYILDSDNDKYKTPVQRM